MELAFFFLANLFIFSTYSYFSAHWCFLPIYGVLLDKFVDKNTPCIVHVHGILKKGKVESVGNLCDISHLKKLPQTLLPFSKSANQNFYKFLLNLSLLTHHSAIVKKNGYSSLDRWRCMKAYSASIKRTSQNNCEMLTIPIAQMMTLRREFFITKKVGTQLKGWNSE